MEELLKSSVKLNNKIIFIGGIMTQTLGIDSTNGQLVYNCSSNGCQTSSSMSNKFKIDPTNENSGNDELVNNLLVIKQSKYLLRAISIENGNEKWNIR